MAETVNATTDLNYRWHIFSEAGEIVTTKFDELNTIIADQTAIVNGLLVDFTDAVNGAATDLGDILTGVVVGDLPTLTLPIFTGIAPTPISVSYNAPVLSGVTEMQEVVGNKLISDISNSSPAIPADVETAIFNREIERALLLHQDTLDAIADEWAKRGFTLPNAYLLAAITQAEIDYSNKRLDRNRDIAIKNFELTDTNMKFAIQQGLAYIINKIEAYKAEIQAEISRIDAEVKVYISQVEVYKGEAQVYSVTIDAAVKEFEARYKKAMLDAEINLKIVDAEIKKVEVQYGIAVESAKAASSVNAQVLAGALSGVSAAAHIQATNTADYSYSTNPSY